MSRDVDFIAHLVAGRDQYLHRNGPEQIAALAQRKKQEPVVPQLFKGRRTFRFGWPIKMSTAEKLAGLEAIGVRLSSVREMFDRLTCGYHLHSRRAFIEGRENEGPGPWRLANVPGQIVQTSDPVLFYYYNLCSTTHGSLFTIEHFLDHLLHRGRWFGFRPDTSFVLDGYDLVLAEDGKPPLSTLFATFADGSACLAEEVELLPFPLGKPKTRVMVIDLDYEVPKKIELQHRNAGASPQDPYYQLCMRFDRVNRVLPGGIWLRSSYSGGLHGFFFFSKPMDAGLIYRRTEELLWTVGLRVENGWVEIFPNPRGGYIRLPLGLGSEVLHPHTLRPCFDPGPGAQVEGLLSLMRVQELPKVLAVPPVQKVAGNCQRWEWDTALAIEITKGGASHPQEIQPSEHVISTSNPTITLEHHPGGIPKLIMDGEKTWLDRHKICFRAVRALKQEGFTHLDSRALSTFERWLLAPENSMHSKSLTKENERRYRVQDLVKVLKWCWPRTRSSLHKTAQELSRAEQEGIAEVVGRYLKSMDVDCRRTTEAALKRVLGEALGRSKAAQGVVSLGRAFWTFRGDGKQRLNTRSVKDNPLYYVCFRDWLIDQGHLLSVGRGVKGRHGNTYIVGSMSSKEVGGA